MASSSDGEEELHSMLGLSVGDLDGVPAEEDGTEAQSEVEEGRRSRLGGPVLICDDAHESAEAFGAYCSGADRAAPPWKLDVEDRPELVEQLVRRCFDGAVARAGGAPVQWTEAHFARVRLNEYVRGAGWDWHQDRVVLTTAGNNRTHKTALLYLSSPERGGETEFLVRPGSVPVAGHRGVSATPITIGREEYDKLTVRPQRGRVVVFDHIVRHRALPVVGSKTIAQVKLCDPTRDGAAALYSF